MPPFMCGSGSLADQQQANHFLLYSRCTDNLEHSEFYDESLLNHPKVCVFILALEINHSSVISASTRVHANISIWSLSLSKLVAALR